MILQADDTSSTNKKKTEKHSSSKKNFLNNIETKKLQKNQSDDVFLANAYAIPNKKKRYDKDILGLSIDKKIKNIINLNIKDKNSNEKNIKKGNKKEDIMKYHSYNVVIDLSSSNDAKNFFKSFKKMSIEFKSHQNKNK